MATKEHTRGQARRVSRLRGRRLREWAYLHHRWRAVDESGARRLTCDLDREEV